MISSFTPPGMAIVALRTRYGVEAGQIYHVRGFVINRHWKTREPDPHVMLVEIPHPVGFPKGKYGPIGFPRDAFDYPRTADADLHRELEVA